MTIWHYTLLRYADSNHPRQRQVRLSHSAPHFGPLGIELFSAMTVCLSVPPGKMVKKNNQCWDAGNDIPARIDCQSFLRPDREF